MIAEYIYTTFDGKTFTGYANAAEDAYNYETNKLEELSEIAYNEIGSDFDRQEMLDRLGNIPNRVLCDIENNLYLSAFNTVRYSEDSTIELGMWDEIDHSVDFSYIVFNALQNKLDEYDDEE